MLWDMGGVPTPAVPDSPGPDAHKWAQVQSLYSEMVPKLRAILQRWVLGGFLRRFLPKPEFVWVMSGETANGFSYN